MVEHAATVVWVWMTWAWLGFWGPSLGVAILLGAAVFVVAAFLFVLIIVIPW